jgi:hypothetical protein
MNKIPETGYVSKKYVKNRKEISRNMQSNDTRPTSGGY